jgi:signal transduction histidine kinase
MSDVLDESQLQQLIELGPALVSELDLDALLDQILETACAITGARYAALGILDDQRRELERFVTRGLSDGEERVIGDRPLGRGVLGLLIEDPVALRIADLNAHPSSFGFPVGHPPMRTFLGVPIIIRGRAWGNLYLTEKAADEFREADERAVTMLAAWASIAIEHSRLLKDAADRQGQLETAVRRLEATQAVAVAVGAETDLSRVLELITKRGRAIVGARSLLILLRDGDELVIASGAGHALARIGARFPVAESTSGEVMLAKRATRVADPASRLQISPERLGVPDAQFALLVPLLYRSEALGVMAAFDHGSGEPEFGADDEQLLVAFAASAATAVATAQTVRSDRLKHSLDAAEAERKRWARELHDETLQALGSMKVLASAAKRAGDPEKMRAALEQLADGLEEQIESVHTVISELRPAALDDLGLRPAIEGLAERHAAMQGAEVVCELELPDPVEGGARLAPELETTVYRLVQEALNNVAKHAQATSVTVGVSTSEGSVTVEVHDNGTGFDISDPGDGFGLTGMRERVTLAGGSLTIESESSGTAVRATLPAPS